MSAKWSFFEALQEQSSLSLYIHVPFCETKCDYCPFYSIPKSKYSLSLIESFHTHLLNELDLIFRYYPKGFDTIYIGGGNPGLLSLDQQRSLIASAVRDFDVREVTMEVHPKQVIPQLATLKDVGLTRLSVGIESLQSQHLKTLGRNSTLKCNIEALKVLKELPFRYNCDLMTSIPGQTVESALLDITLLDEGATPSHISLYNVTYEEGTRLTQRLEDHTLSVSSEDQQYEILQESWKKLEQLGYHQYEISNFARTKESQSQHNNRYWDAHSYVGLGPSAVGSLYTEGHALRSTCIEEVNSYVQSEALSSYDIEYINHYELMEEYLLSRLRTSEGVNFDRWYTIFKTHFVDQFEAVLRFLETYVPSYIDFSPTSFSLTPEGRMVSDTIILRFVEALESK